ncbi:MAG TPA: hypothetical protein VGP55_03075 [Chitinophagaceae bacterium]|nr:hypothetical protein [Chitinophagaceae bacterium]
MLISSAKDTVNTKINESWTLIINEEGREGIEVMSIPFFIDKSLKVEKDVNKIHVTVNLEMFENSVEFNAIAHVKKGEVSVYFSLVKNYTQEIPYNFNGPVNSTEVYRQSPHDVNAWIVNNIAMQAVPVVALKNNKNFEVALNGSPAFYENGTSQAFYLDEKRVELSSGDNGTAPGLHPSDLNDKPISYNTEKGQIMSQGKICKIYHKVTNENPHEFKGLLFKCKSGSVSDLRKEVVKRAASFFSNRRYTDYFGSLSFVSSYMNLRRNESGKSKFWVVPSVEYANTQYCRDAFWISTMLSDEMSAESLKSELDSVNQYAEYPLLTILWAYRLTEKHIKINPDKLQNYINAIETHVHNGYYYSFNETDGRLDFQYWGDLIAFEKNDVVTYNQGLLVLALKAAQKMGLHTSTSSALALSNYQMLFNTQKGFYPISRLKNSISAPDPVVPDLLSKILFNHSLLPISNVQSHYNFVTRKLKTKYGYKCIARDDGSFLSDEDYNAGQYIAQANKENMPDGRYFRGGSYFLYDNLFLINAYLDGIKGAEEELKWRVGLDFKIGGTTYECLNTLTGEPWKPNMGWNVAIYSIWRKLMDQGKASNSLLNYIDSLAGNKIHAKIVITDFKN